MPCMAPGLHIFQTGSTPSRHNNTYIKWIAVYYDSKASSHCLASKPALGGRPPFCGASRRFIVTPLWPMMRGSTVQEKQAINRKDGDTAADTVSTPGPSIPESSHHMCPPSQKRRWAHAAFIHNQRTARSYAFVTVTYP